MSCVVKCKYPGLCKNPRLHEMMYVYENLGFTQEQINMAMWDYMDFAEDGGTDKIDAKRREKAMADLSNIIGQVSIFLYLICESRNIPVKKIIGPVKVLIMQKGCTFNGVHNKRLYTNGEYAHTPFGVFRIPGGGIPDGRVETLYPSRRRGWFYEKLKIEPTWTQPVEIIKVLFAANLKKLSDLYNKREKDRADRRREIIDVVEKHMGVGVKVYSFCLSSKP